MSVNLMPVQRPPRMSHLPSFSDDLSDDVRSWRKTVPRSGSNYARDVDRDEGYGKSPLTKIRVWIGSRFSRTRKNFAKTRGTLLLVILCSTFLYYWSTLKSSDSSYSSRDITAPAFEVEQVTQVAQNPPKQRYRPASHKYRSDGLLEGGS